MENRNLKIEPKSRISIDEDLSFDKINYLINLGIEEERLEFKQKYDFSTKASSKKSKIDLVCDIVSMANTFGGYILVGFKEKDDHSFDLIGVGIDIIKKLSQEDIINIITNFIDARIKVGVKTHKKNGNTIISIFVAPSKILIPFKQDGQHEKDGTIEVKFKAGEIFVRHGAISRKANYLDIVRFVEMIRKDEREKLAFDFNINYKLINRFDQLISVIGNKPSDFKEFEISNHSFIEIEMHFAQTLNEVKYQLINKRSINQFFADFKKELINEESNLDTDIIKENVDRIFQKYLDKVIPVWNALNIFNEYKMAKLVSGQLFSLYNFIHGLKGSYINLSDLKLLLQARIVYLIMVLGSISIAENKLSFTPMLIKRKGIENESLEHLYWFRYILIWLSRRSLLNLADLIGLAYENYKDAKYLLNVLESYENILKYMCQFDYLQCLQTYIDGLNDKDCWPSFKFYDKKLVEGFIGEIIDDSKKDNWLGLEGEKKLANCIQRLEDYTPGPDYFWKYSNNKWVDPNIGGFVQTYNID